MNYVEIIGNGTSNNALSNARALDWDGNEYLGGNLYINCNPDSTNGNKVISAVDYATTDTVGVIKVGSGLYIDGSTHKLSCEKANDAQIKACTAEYRPLVPSNQHAAVFYGLAKAAGVDMKNSENSVGTYTAEAQAAIQAMLGIVSASGVSF
jgi:hypothetical protein